MNINAVLIIVLFLLSFVSTNKNTKLYFTAFSLMMLGHCSTVLALPVSMGGYYYLSGAVFTSYLTFFTPKTKQNFILLSVCGASILANVIGGVLWRLDMPDVMHYEMFLGIYIAAICYVAAQGVKNGDYSRGLYSLRNLYNHSYSNINRRLGSHQ